MKKLIILLALISLLTGCSTTLKKMVIQNKENEIQKMSLNEKDKSELTDALFTLMIERKDNEIISKKLIDSGADINYRFNLNGPLFEFLLNSKGQAVTIKAGDSMLMIAIKTNSNKIAKLFVEAGADINIGDLLATSILNNNEDMIKLLLAKGIKITEKDVSAAIKENNINFLKVFFETNVYIKLKEAEVNSVEVANLLLDRGEKLSIFGLKTAILKNNIEVVKYLIEKGANVDKTAGIINLFVAVEADNLEILEYLLSKGADINIKDGLYQTPLKYAKKMNRTRIVEYLSKKGARE